MKLFWCCLAVWIPIINAAINVEKTVQQVQTILKTNALLPRLSREEIIQLLNDIRAEDEKSSSTSNEKSNEILTTLSTSYVNVKDNEINPVIQSPQVKDNILAEKKEINSTTDTPIIIESTTKHSGQKLTVVLPYTPRDGSSLQELYTRPPRLEVVQEKVTPKPIKPLKSINNIKETLIKNANTANKQKFDIPQGLQEFLDSHGLKGNFAEDHFLLPLEGFKPLPPARIVDGEVQLPENILLTYDLISPSDLKSLSNKEPVPANSNTNFLYEPLQPDFPFELDTSSSESKQMVLPLDLPTKTRKPKSVANVPQLNYDPIEYDSVKVIPLGQGPNPIDNTDSLNGDQSKRQINETNSNNETTTVTISTSADSEQKVASTTTVSTNIAKSDFPGLDSAASDTDTGASIADLEDSFGGAAPAEPGDSVLPPPKKNGFYWMVDWNSFLEVGDGDTKVNIRFEPKLGDPQMFLPVNVP